MSQEFGRPYFARVEAGQSWGRARRAPRGRNPLSLLTISVKGSLQRTAVTPLIPAQRPIAVLRQLQRGAAAVADLDHVAGDGEVVEEFGVVSVEVQAPVRG